MKPLKAASWPFSPYEDNGVFLDFIPDGQRSIADPELSFNAPGDWSPECGWMVRLRVYNGSIVAVVPKPTDYSAMGVQGSTTLADRIGALMRGWKEKLRRSVRHT